MPGPYNTTNNRAELLAMQVVDLLQVDGTKISDSRWSRLCMLLGAEDFTNTGRQQEKKLRERVRELEDEVERLRRNQEATA